MKYFTEPTGKFVIKIPIEWQYKNIAVGIGEVSPFSFQPYHRSIGAFQLSCYSQKDIKINKNFIVQKSDTDNLKFVKARMDDSEFNIHLWYATVDDHMFMAKYIYDASKAGSKAIKKQLEKVELTLSTLVLISPAKRELAVELDKYDKFIAALSASFDLKNKALESQCLIELLVIIANQIDAYLRMAIVITKQLDEKTDRIDLKLLFQGDNDSPIMERAIYRQSKDLGIINSKTFDKLEDLYKERNKVIHRYIITEFKTRYLYQIAYEYERICEVVRLTLKRIEDMQAKTGLGIYGKRSSLNNLPDEEDIKLLFSRVNDKHLIKELYRKIKI